MAKAKKPTPRPNRKSSTKTNKPSKIRKKWTFLHKGPVLAPPYKPIPKKYKLEYASGQRKVEVKLTPLSEEYAMHFARYLKGNSATKAQDKLLRKNFFEDWTSVMNNKEKAQIKTLQNCRFERFIQYLEDEKERKKNLSPTETATLKREKEKIAGIHKVVNINGKQEYIGNFMVEPPGLYMGRGANQNIGRVKKRIQLKDITINCSNPERFPNRNKYKAVISNPTVTWIAHWKDSITGRPKYIQLHGSSNIKAESDKRKYDNAMTLSRKIKFVENSYKQDLNSKDLKTQQHATAIYLVHNLALRAGNEKTSKEEANTVGCCSLQKVNLLVTDKGNKIHLKFLGKDSVEFNKEINVNSQVKSNLKKFVKKKPHKQKIFDKISTTSLNNYLQQKMKGLTAKVFRTYMATDLFKKEIAKEAKTVKNETDVRIKTLAVQRAFLSVAKLLNHKTLVNAKKKKQALKRLQERFDSQQRHFRLKQQQEKRKLGQRPSVAFERLKEKMKFWKKELEVKKEQADYAPQTSKVNYIDPRVVIEWLRKLDIPIEKVYTKAQRAKFNWAIGNTL